MSPLPWANTLRRWDGATAIYERGGWAATGFGSWFAADPDGRLQQDGHRPALLGRLRHWTGGRLARVDLYYLGYGRKGARAWNGTTGDETRHTLGGRVFGRAGSAWDFDAEFAYQFGEVGAGSVNAYMIGSEIGHTLKDVSWSSSSFSLLSARGTRYSR